MLRPGMAAGLALLAWMWAAAVLAAPRPVVIVEIPEAAPELREKMRAAAQDGLDAAGVTVPRQLPTPPQDCSSPDCLVERSQRFGATHVLEIQGSYSNESYKLRLNLRTVNGQQILGSESKECEICSARDFLRAIKDRTLALWTRVAREQASVSTAESDESSPADRPSLHTSSPQRAPRALWQQPLPLAGLGLMLAGVVAMGFGGYYLAVDGEDAPNCEEPCIRQRTTSWLGWYLMGGGGGALLLGTTLVLLGRDAESATTLSLGPGRILLSGRF